MFSLLTFTIAGITLCPYNLQASDRNDTNKAIVHETAPLQKGKIVTVTVSDNIGPVVGANVAVKGTTNGNITDIDGIARLDNVPENATLLISFVGYISKEISVAGQTSFNVQLQEDTKIPMFEI